MFRFFAHLRERHHVDAGRVACPVRARDVEYDLCAGCRQLIEIRLDATPPYLRCAPAAPTSPLE